MPAQLDVGVEERRRTPGRTTARLDGRPTPSKITGPGSSYSPSSSASSSGASSATHASRIVDGLRDER
jgi:hypothetical protein